jgi:branched-chain amino acid aminotransferase
MKIMMFGFRPDQNYNRFNTSAVRMAMPEVPEELYMSGLTQLLTKNGLKGKGKAMY